MHSPAVPPGCAALRSTVLLGWRPILCGKVGCRVQGRFRAVLSARQRRVLVPSASIRGLCILRQWAGRVGVLWFSVLRFRLPVSGKFTLAACWVSFPA
jgi:hypothetical protein